MSLVASSILPALLSFANPAVEWDAPGAYVAGRPFPVELSVQADETGAVLPAWILTPAAFEVDGTPLALRSPATIELAPGATLSLAYDLGPFLDAAASFQLGCATGLAGGEPRAVQALRPVAAELDFMTVPEETLASYIVLMETIQGDMIFEVWPDVAPNHVRNFLDLNHRGFFEKIPFHRVSPAFMIQGGDAGQRLGDPPRWTGGKVTRTVNAEFSDREHVRGVLSAARLGHDVNSATSQFFVMVTKYPTLDGKYSTFGKMIVGDETLTRIANARGRMAPDRTIRPDEPQLVLRTSVLQPF